MVDRFNMVDMGGIDLINSRGLVVPGLHSKLVESITPCRYLMIYNFSFAGIIIPPTVVEAELEGTDVVINEYIVVDANDEINIPSFEPILSILLAPSNGLYLPESGVEGFSQVNVEVPEPVLVEKSITENGTYVPTDDNADGYSEVTVDVVTGGVPSGYQLVNYIESDGTQAIDTSVLLTANSILIVDMMVSGANWTWCLNTASADGTKSVGLVQYSNKVGAYQGTGYERWFTGYNGNRHIYLISSFELGATGSFSQSGSQGTFICTDYSVVVFGTHTTSGGIEGLGVGRLYRLIIDGHDFRPCQRLSDGAYGLIDLSDGSFHGDALDGNAFVAG